jgi:predicted acylesterase/phospholipase RssA
MPLPSNSSPSVARCLWYRQPNAVNRWFNGVFEGGGAKGIAYTGALKALKRRNCWFNSVAGSSAGSITAALVAAGFDPEEIEAMAEAALKTVRPSAKLGLRTLMLLSRGYGYYDKNSLRLWIKDTLKSQLSDLGSASGDPNFYELFDSTGIELNVIATSLSLKSLVVFSCHETPDCSVADAVAASASIPFVFGDSLLEVKDIDGTTWHQTIVDGGVWANFPWFVYTDRNFRALYKRTGEVPPDSIIGFVLDESRSFDKTDDDLREAKASCLLKGSGIKFSDVAKVKPWEKRPVRTSRREKETLGIQPRILSWLGRLFAILGKAVTDAQAKQVSPDRWPEPGTSFYKNIVEHFSGLFQRLTGPVALIVTLFIAFSTLFMFWRVTTIVFPWWWSTLPWFSVWGVVVKFILAFLWGTIFLAILFVVEGVFVLFLTASLLNGPLRRIGYGLITTYVSGSGASEWTCNDPRIVSLPVAGIRTTDFYMNRTTKEKLIKQAEKETNLRLTFLGVPTQKK